MTKEPGQELWELVFPQGDWRSLPDWSRATFADKETALLAPYRSRIAELEALVRDLRSSMRERYTYDAGGAGEKR